jgi:hypothetical protein
MEQEAKGNVVTLSKNFLQTSTNITSGPDEQDGGHVVQIFFVKNR